MSYSNVIGSVSNALRLLLDRIQDTTVTILPPDQSNVTERRLNIFLYKVSENNYLKNKDWFANPNNPTEILPPPLSLNLHYLITPYAPLEDDNIRAAHDMLGEAMRLIYENSTLPQDILDEANLDDLNENIKLTLEDLDMDELSKIWGAFDVPYRLSVGYEVSVVQIDQIPETSTAMPPRIQSIGGIAIGLANNLPSDLSLVEKRVRRGENITITGQNMVGWRASARLGNRYIADGLALVDNSITLTIPLDAGLGVQLLRVDVSGLKRSSFYIEVYDD